MFLDALKGSNNWMPKNTCWLGDACYYLFKFNKSSLSLTQWQYRSEQQAGSEPNQKVILRKEVTCRKLFSILLLFCVLWSGCGFSERLKERREYCKDEEMVFSEYRKISKLDTFEFSALPLFSCRNSYTMDYIKEKLGPPFKIYVDTGIVSGAYTIEGHPSVEVWCYPVSHNPEWTTTCYVLYFDFKTKKMCRTKERFGYYSQYVFLDSPCDGPFEGYRMLLSGHFNYPYITNQLTAPWSGEIYEKGKTKKAELSSPKEDSGQLIEDD